MQKIVFIFLIVTNFNLLIASLNDNHWQMIVRDIARDGDAKDREEFEAAKQAFMHIKDEEKAKLAAQDIQKKWNSTFSIQASVGSTMKKGSLMSLTRYPLMTKEDAQKATQLLLTKRDMVQFLDEQKIKVTVL